MFTLKELRRRQYRHNKHYLDWDSPYTSIKMRFIIETGALLVWVLQYTNIHPNTITIAFALTGIFGGVLLIFKPVLGVAIFFLKTILDEADGHLARIKNQTSEFGKHLDYYAGTIVTVSFYIGVLLGHFYLTLILVMIYLFGKLDGRARTMDLLCLLILLKEFL